MVRDDARLVAFNNLQLPSTVGYVDNSDDSRIHWDIAYFYDNMRENGYENRGAFKFYNDLCQTITNKAFASNDVSLRTSVARHVGVSEISKNLSLKISSMSIFFFAHGVKCLLEFGDVKPISLAVRPGLLDRNLCTSLALIICMFTFVNKAREPAKAAFLLSYLKAIGFMVMPWVSAVAGVRVRFPANRVETLFVTSAGNLAFAAFLNNIHRGIATAWSQEWHAMFSAGHLSSDWQAEVHVVDMMIFVATLERYRRSRRKPVMGQMSIKLLEDLKDLLATFVSTAMDQFLLQMYTQEQPDQAQQAAPARKFKKLAMLLQLVF